MAPIHKLGGGYAAPDIDQRKTRTRRGTAWTAGHPVWRPAHRRPAEIVNRLSLDGRREWGRVQAGESNVCITAPRSDYHFRGRLTCRLSDTWAFGQVVHPTVIQALTSTIPDLAIRAVNEGRRKVDGG